MCIRDRKMALFALIPDNDASFNFLVSLLYASTFQQLFYLADHKHNGSLPVPVHFVMDEFANVSLPSDFDKLLATMRSRNISVSIILQNIAQLKALFEKEWESIAGNCDEFLYLGGNETSTHKPVSYTHLFNVLCNTSSNGGNELAKGQFAIPFRDIPAQKRDCGKQASGSSYTILRGLSAYQFSHATSG